MKIKTKRGARRIRNQRVVDRRFVVTDYDRCSYITAGKLYRVFDGTHKPVLSVIDDYDDEITCVLGDTSAHLDEIGTWYHPIR